MIANIPGSVPAGVEAVQNDEPLGYAANLNKVRVDDGAARRLGQPRRHARARRDRGALDVHGEPSDRCGVAGPRMVYPDGTWQPSRRRFPTVAGTIVRRTPLRLVVPQRRHFHLDSAVPTEPVEADWMLGGFLMLRRAMLDELGGFDEGFRLYGEDIDLQYRAMRAGWERWYVPSAVVRHEHQAETDKRWLTRRTLWHWAGIARFVRKHPERLRALG